MTAPTDGHEHAMYDVGIVIVFILLFVGLVTLAEVNNARLDIIYDRVGEMQRQLECPPSELIVTDNDGVEYCLDPSTTEGGE